MSPADERGFDNPTRVIFGVGTLNELGKLLAGRALLVTTPGHTRRGLTERVEQGGVGSALGAPKLPDYKPRDGQ